MKGLLGKIIAIALMGALALCMFTACGGAEKPDENSLSTIKVHDKLTAVEVGDDYYESQWGEDTECYKGDEIIDGGLVLRGGVKIDMDINDVLDILEVKPGYAVVDSEIGNGDGTTDVTVTEYKDLEHINNAAVLDSNFRIIYKQNGDDWEMMTAKEAEDFDVNTAKNVLVINIDVACKATAKDAGVKPGTVMIVSIARY